MMRYPLAALLFVAAILLAGSDGPLFPWPNLIGCGLFALFAVLMQKPPKKEIE